MICLNYVVNLYSTKSGEIKKFLNSFYETTVNIENEFKWNKYYQNPVEMTNIISSLIENNDKYKINIWISLDEGIFINVTENNIDSLIRYIYERFPY